jgi:uncharacterized RDD family membrane protein YckC
MTTEIAILSPEKTIVTYRLASLGSRVLALVVDALCVLAIEVIIAMAMNFLESIGNPVLASFATLRYPLYSASIFLYFILLEGLWNGQTLGKKACSLRVRNADGTPVTFQNAVGRNLLRTADWLPGLFFLGSLLIFLTPKAQRFGDIVCGTIVITERRGDTRFAAAPHRIATEAHPYEQYVGELRGMTLDEYKALRRLCDRFPELPALIQDRLLREVWKPIGNRRGVAEMPGVHPIYLAEATVMKYGRQHGLL